MAAQNRRPTLKRGELFQLGELLKARIDRHGALVAYRGESSDAEVAELATRALKTEIDAKLVATVRQQLFGKLANEGRTTPEMVDGLLRQNSALSAALKALTARVDSLEKLLTEPDQPLPRDNYTNGARR